MSFNSIIFIFYFLPITLLLYHLSSKKLKNAVLLIASLIFYAWGSVYTLHVIALTIIVNYLFGLAIENYKSNKKFILSLGVICNIGILTYYKYTNFFINSFNDTFGKKFNLTIANLDVAVIIGLSYIIFQCISYLVDVYRQDEKAVKNFIDFSMYITLFPKLIAGPILKFKDFAYQLTNRNHSIDKFIDGIHRFCVGLGKKVLIATTLEIAANKFFSTQPYMLGISYAWLGMITYTLQIYYDFSGYTDMAIGMSKMLGFDLPENFNKPYTATSISDFWKRWHISLTSFLRDYIYIPLGGNRKGRFRSYLNTFIVFFVSGFWHGAKFTFIVWGIYHGVIMIIEKLFLGKVLKRLPKFICQIYAFIAAAVGWVFFTSTDLKYSLSYIKALIIPKIPQHNLEYYSIDNKFIFIIIIAFIMAIIPQIKVTTLKDNGEVVLSLKAIFSLVIFILSVASITTGTFLPFIYLKF